MKILLVCIALCLGVSISCIAQTKDSTAFSFSHLKKKKTMFSFFNFKKDTAATAQGSTAKKNFNSAMYNNPDAQPFMEEIKKRVDLNIRNTIRMDKLAYSCQPGFYF